MLTLVTRFMPHGSTFRRAQGPELSRGTSSPSRAKSRDVSRFLGAGRERRRRLRIVRRSRKVNVGQAPRTHNPFLIESSAVTVNGKFGPIGMDCFSWSLISSHQPINGS